MKAKQNPVPLGALAALMIHGDFETIQQHYNHCDVCGGPRYFCDWAVDHIITSVQRYREQQRP